MNTKPDKLPKFSLEPQLHRTLEFIGRIKFPNGGPGRPVAPVHPEGLPPDDAPPPESEADNATTDAEAAERIARLFDAVIDVIGSCFFENIGQTGFLAMDGDELLDFVERNAISLDRLNTARPAILRHYINTKLRSQLPTRKT